jgi:hypothetical protein
VYIIVPSRLKENAVEVYVPGVLCRHLENVVWPEETFGAAEVPGLPVGRDRQVEVMGAAREVMEVVAVNVPSEDA